MTVFPLSVKRKKAEDFGVQEHHGEHVVQIRIERPDVFKVNTKRIMFSG